MSIKRLIMFDFFCVPRNSSITNLGISALILSTVLNCSCKFNDTDAKGPQLPIDYLYAQRSFPYNKIDKQAYLQALEWKNKHSSSAVRNDDQWQSQGPTNMDGRVTDIEIHPDNDNIIYAGTASGGVSLSEDGGVTWRPVFDDNPQLSIGDIAIDQSNPDRIYVGTGEPNAGGGSIAYDGNGVYLTEDGGQSWSYKGLPNSGSIGKIVLDPKDGNKVFVAAMGTLFSKNEERGVYRSVNGGDTWEQVLFLSDSTGAIDLVIHPLNENIIYAAMWERIRRPDDRQYGGETSGIYRSVDGGSSWHELTNDLPSYKGNKGRIGLSISPSHPQVIYANYIDQVGYPEAVFKSSDGGNTWKDMNVRLESSTSYAWWFGKIFIHPSDTNRIYYPGLSMYGSRDGSDNWTQVFNGAHVDHHVITWSQQNDSITFNGNDGGIYKSNNYGNLPIEYLNGLNNFQFYTCTIDPLEPDKIFGGAQDNGVLFQSIKDDTDSWEKIRGGDGFRVLVDPTNNDIIYHEIQYGAIRRSDNGGISTVNITDGLSGSFNWNTPLEFDYNNSNIIYTGAQNLFRSEDRGDNWEMISPDLPGNPDSGLLLSYGTITAIEPGITDSELIYVGTDNGKVWRTLDGGNSWDEISLDIPKRWVTAIASDPWSEDGVYLTLSGFRYGDSEAQVFYSSDMGENWNEIGSSLPDVPVNDIIVDDKLFGTLYIATDIGVFWSQDNGDSWSIYGSNMPNVVVTDIDIHSSARLLSAASYGRGIFTIQLPESTNVIEKTDDIISFYPNPVRDVLHVNANKKIESVELIDLSGKLVLKSNETDISIPDNVKSGTYLLRIYYHGTFQLFKCIIVK